MCIICVQLELDKITSSEALRNLSEMRFSLSEEHIEEVQNLVAEQLNFENLVAEADKLILEARAALQQFKKDVQDEEDIYDHGNGD